MLVIRFFRVGKKNQPSFKIVVTDKRNPPRGGRFVEEVGSWSPLTKEKLLKGERIKYWISKGAKPSDSVYNLLVSGKIIEGKKIPVHKLKKLKEEEKKEIKKEEKKTEEPKTEEVKKEEEKAKEIKPEETKEKPKEEKSQEAKD